MYIYLHFCIYITWVKPHFCDIFSQSFKVRKNMEFHQFASHLAIKYQVIDFIFWIVLQKYNWYFFNLIIELTGWCWQFIQIAQVGHFLEIVYHPASEVPLTHFFSWQCFENIHAAFKILNLFPDRISYIGKIWLSIEYLQ